VKLCCFGDIHLDGSRRVLDGLRRELEEACGDVDAAVIVGDLTASGRLDLAKELLRIVREALDPVPIMVVPGNHDIYVSAEESAAGVNSLMKLSAFNSLVERMGCVALMKRPFAIGSIGFVGSIGWYDYSFAPQWLNLPLEAYREKAYGLYIWTDREFVKLSMSDEEFALELLNRFEQQIEEIESSVDRIVAVLHHLPFRELVTYRIESSWDYFSTFMGSEAFGYAIEKHRKIRAVLYGHSHDGVETRTCREVRGVKCCNCASPKPIVVEV